MVDGEGVLRGASVREPPDAGREERKQESSSGGTMQPWVMKHEDVGRKRQRYSLSPTGKGVRQFPC